MMDAIKFLMKSGHPKFADTQGTIHFIRVVDELFAILNSRSLISRGFKRPLLLHDSRQGQRGGVIKVIADYLFFSKDF